MKHTTLVEMTIPANADCHPEIHTDGTYELLWKLKTGSYARLIFENGEPVREMLGKVAMLETQQRQIEQAEATA